MWSTIVVSIYYHVVYNSCVDILSCGLQLLCQYIIMWSTIVVSIYYHVVYNFSENKDLKGKQAKQSMESVKHVMGDRSIKNKAERDR